jgi:hypothetical protein
MRKHNHGTDNRLWLNHRFVLLSGRAWRNWELPSRWQSYCCDSSTTLHCLYCFYLHCCCRDCVLEQLLTELSICSLRHMAVYGDPVASIKLPAKESLCSDRSRRMQFFLDLKCMLVNFASLRQNIWDHLRGRKILDHNFRGLCPWLFGPVAFGPMTKQYIMSKGHGQGNCWPNGS